MKNKALIICLLITTIGFSQVGINNTDPKASLDVTAINQAAPNNTDGLLIPRIDDFPATNPTAAQQGMMIYLTTASGSNPPGFYYWDNTAGPATWESVVGVKNTLDEAYDQGGAGMGRTINVNSGVVNLTGNSEMLELYSTNITDSNKETLRINSFLNNNSDSGIYIHLDGTNPTASPSLGITNAIKNHIEHNTTNGITIGLSNNFVLGINSGGLNTGCRGVYNNFYSNSNVNGTNWGVINRFNESSNRQIGIENIYRDSAETTYGLWNRTQFNVSSNYKGIYNDFDNNSTTAQTTYGVHTEISGSSTGEKYGSFINISQTAAGTHYGIYADVQKANSYAGYFLGSVSIGTNTVNNYIFPSSRGTANQILQTDGSGQLSFIDPATIGDGTGTDDQDLLLPTLTGTTLNLNIQDGSGTSINLAPIQDGTGTDDQIIETFSFNTGTNNLTLEIENGNSTFVNLASLQGTDDQTINTFSFNTGTNIITLEIEDDGVDAQTVNLSSINGDITSVDAGTGLIGSGTSGNIFLDVVATNGLTNLPDSIKLGGALTENTNITAGAFNFNFNLDSTGDFSIKDNGSNVFQVMDDGRVEFPKVTTATPFENSGIIEIGNSLRLDHRSIITNTEVELLLQNGNNGDLWVDWDTFSVDASANSVGIGTQTPISKLDIFGQITIRGGNPLPGSVLTSNAIGTATWETPTTGTVTSVIAGDGLVSSGTNDITLDVVATNGLTATANSIQLGGQIFVNTTLDVDANLNFDVTTGGFNIVSGGNNYFNVDGNGNIIADFNDNTFTVDPNTNRVGIGTSIPLAKLDVVGSFRSTSVQSLGGIQIGALFGSGRRLVATSFDGQLQDVADGLANQVLKTDGAGNYSWETPTTGDITTVTAGDGLINGGTAGDVTLDVVATNGLTATADTIKLGGALTENTNITAGAFNINFNLNSTGDFSVQDNGTKKLEVLDNGDTVLGGDLYFRDGSTSGTIIARLTDTGNDGVLDIYKDGNITNKFRGDGISYINGGSVGVGTTSPDSKFSVIGAISSAFETAETNKITMGHGGSNAYINVVGLGRLDFRHEGSNGMSFTDTNRLGINNTDPDYTLSVTGVTNLNEDVASGVALRVNGSEALWYDGSRFSWGYGGTSNTFANDVGIGMTSAPSYRLDVRDNRAGDFIAQIYNTSTNVNADGLKIRLGNTSAPNTANSFMGFFDGNNTSRGRIRGDGTGVQFLTTSDRRLKTNIVNINDALELINNIQPRKYEFKTNLGVKEYGFIAQELQLQYPQAVSGSSDSNVDTDPMMVDYSRLTPLLTAGIKELKEEMDTLKEENKELKFKLSKYESLEARLVALEECNNTREVLQNSISENK